MTDTPTLKTKLTFEDDVIKKLAGWPHATLMASWRSMVACSAI